MKIVILAAGIGSRLRPETTDNPKAMIYINQKPLIQYQVESVLKAGFTYEDVYIVGGYKIERIEEHFKGKNVHFIFNPYFETMNNIYSFYLTECIGDDLILINSDDFYDERLLPLIINSDYPTCVLIDKQKIITEESMRVKIENNRLLQVNKKMELSIADGEYIGISKLSNVDLKILYQKALEMLKAGDIHAWYENVYEACADQLEIGAVFTEGYPWIEIDDCTDLENAKQLASIIGLK